MRRFFVVVGFYAMIFFLGYVLKENKFSIKRKDIVFFTNFFTEPKRCLGEFAF
jgi:hypothetical protein